MPHSSDNPGRLAPFLADGVRDTADAVATAVHLLLVREGGTPFTVTAFTRARHGCHIGVVGLQLGEVVVELGFEGALAAMQALEDEAGPARARLVDAQRLRRAAFNALAQAYAANLAATLADEAGA